MDRTAATAQTPRRIGRIGTVARVVVGLALLHVALADRPVGVIWGLERHEVVLGWIVFPTVMMAVHRCGGSVRELRGERCSVRDSVYDGGGGVVLRHITARRRLAGSPWV